MTKSPPTTAIEILTVLWATAYNRGLDHADFIYYSLNDNNKVKQEALAELESLMMGVIGEDDDNVRGLTQSRLNPAYWTKRTVTRNEFRTQQRTALKAIFKQEV